MEESPRIDDLTPEEVRVLGCLVEKESTTPDNYPLTLNSLRSACNQSTSRDPVVAFTDHDVERALSSLRGRGLTRTVHSSSNRAAKYRHVLPDVRQLEPAELALVSVLMLRGPQTVGELKNRSERQHHFDSTDEVETALTELAARDRPLALHLERQLGQKDARWVHLLSEPGQIGSAAADVSGAEGEPTADLPDDPYGEATAEFYDLLATGHWESFGNRLLDLFADVDPSSGPIVDVGAGTGIGLAYLQVAIPEAHIHAVEPSRAMRTALHTRLLLDPELCAITTVDPRPLGEAVLPERACALVASAALGHFSVTERQRLWRYVTDHMPAGAPAVIELLPPERPLTIPPTCYRRVSVGEYTYEGWQQGEPDGNRDMLWTMTYKVLHGDTVISENTMQSGWRCFTVDDVRTEIESFGLTLAEHPDCVVITS